MSVDCPNFYLLTRQWDLILGMQLVIWSSDTLYRKFIIADISLPIIASLITLPMCRSCAAYSKLWVYSPYPWHILLRPEGFPQPAQWNVTLIYWLAWSSVFLILHHCTFKMLTSRNIPAFLLKQPKLLADKRAETVLSVWNTPSTSICIRLDYAKPPVHRRIWAPTSIRPSFGVVPIALWRIARRAVFWAYRQLPEATRQQFVKRREKDRRDHCQRRIKATWAEMSLAVE